MKYDLCIQPYLHSIKVVDPVVEALLRSDWVVLRKLASDFQKPREEALHTKPHPSLLHEDVRERDVVHDHEKPMFRTAEAKVKNMTQIEEASQNIL